MTSATEGFYDQQIMNSIPLGNYATVSRNSVGRSPTAFGGGAKSQTVSGQSRKLPAAGRGALRKVGTVSPLFQVLRFPAILSTASIELSQSKIQTPSGKFRRRLCEIRRRKKTQPKDKFRGEEAGCEIL
jgi:hypothetical protein